MSEKIETINAKRRLDLSSATTKREGTKVKNPYLKAPKSASTKTEEDATTKIATITPEAGIEKFFVSKRRGDAKPRAARTLVTPRENNGVLQQQDNHSLEFASEGDDTRDLYYHSCEESHHSKRAKLQEAGHIHSILGYHHRGELPLDQGTLKAYRFIRNHFLIPCNIEADPKFGAYSGSSFEERVIRAYTLGQLEPNVSSENECSLLVCSFCGDEGHKRDGCLKLL